MASRPGARTWLVRERIVAEVEMRALEVPLTDLQPSQLWVSDAKLHAVEALETCEPVPVWRLGGSLVITDGHTRALAAHRAGRRTTAAVRETDDGLDREAYRICIRWCREAGIRSVPDLEDRVVSAAEYETRWLARCRALHARLARERRL